METMEKTMNKTNFKMSADNFETEISEFITRLKRYIDFMDYQVTGDVNFDELENLKVKITQSSLTQKKKLRNFLLSANHKMSLRSINRFLHFLYKNVLETDKRVRIKVSVEEQQIQMRRKEWVSARNKAEAALFIYKKIKGDFYKDKIKKMEISKVF